MESSTHVSGTVTYVSKTYNDRWAWGKIEVPGRVTELKISGPILQLRPGMSVTLTGQYVTHPKYGEQFEVVSAVEDLPSTKESFSRWLSENLPQVGDVRAELIYDKFGEGIWNVLEEDCQQLCVISGITPARAELIRQAYQGVKKYRELTIHALEVGFAMADANRLVDSIKQRVRTAADKNIEESVSIKLASMALDKNPCILSFWTTIPYVRCAAVHENRGYDLLEPYYLAGAVNMVLTAHAYDGHTAMTWHELASAVIDECTVQVSRDRFLAELALIVHGERLPLVEQPISLGADVYMLPSLYEAERSIAEGVIKLEQRREERDRIAHTGTKAGSAHGTHQSNLRDHGRTWDGEDDDPEGFAF